MQLKIRYPSGSAKVIIKDEKEFIQRHWIGGCFYEAKRGGMMNYLYQNVPRGGKWIDIGASIGNHTMFFNAIMKADEIHSIEPFKPSFDHLNENVKLNSYKNVKTYNFALGAKQGLCTMESQHPEQVGMMQVRKGEDVELRTVDSCDFFEGYDVIKIDVEHYNEQLLKGAKKTFTEGKGLIFIEAEFEEELETVDKYMYSYGYKRKEGVKLNTTPTYLYCK